ncbi:MAG: 50S ribosomal protein L24 [Pseudomonadota bacterium]
MNIRKGDMVMVVTGKDRGKTGKVLSIDTQKSRVYVQGLNMIKKHQKPTQTKRQGGIVEKEASLHISNVMFYDEKLSKPTRVGYKFLDDGKKVRISKKTGDVIETRK